MLSLNGTELSICSLGNRLAWHNKINLFLQNCRYYLRKISEASLAALWISIIQQLQHECSPS
jgi:hypothetical protein